MRNPECWGCARGADPLSERSRTIAGVRCPVCDGKRVLLAAVPGDQPGALRVCLDCAALWDRPADED